jgi:hypothetical protein
VSARAGQEQILCAHLSVMFSAITSGMLVVQAKITRRKHISCAMFHMIYGGMKYEILAIESAEKIFLIAYRLK